MEGRNNKRKLILVVSLFAVIYSLISFVNHYHFRTYALDLGLYTNALYDYSHFQWNDSSVFKETSENLLADHFDFYLILISPLSYVFRTYTLLVMQIFFVLLGGVGVYKCVQAYTSNSSLSLWATVYFYLFFGVFAALSFDYHSNVVAATLVPWFFYFFHQRKMVATSLVFVAILISKENISLWMIFVCLGLMFNYKKDKSARKYLLVFASFSAFYFIAVIYFVMPALSVESTYHHFDYHCLGNDFKSAIVFLFSHPIDSLQLLFVNHSGNPSGDYVKIEAYVLLLISGMYLLFLKPQYLLMLVPIFFQKMFHDNIQMWSVITHYCVEFAPILAIGIFSSLNVISSSKTKNILTIIILIGCASSTCRVMDNTLIPTDRERIRIYVPKHYKRNYDVKIIHEEFNKIPGDAIVSAQSPYLPQLALRDKIYQFPIIKDADFIIFSTIEQPYPLNKEEFEKFTYELMNSPEWKIQFKGEGVVILRRVK